VIAAIDASGLSRADFFCNRWRTAHQRDKFSPGRRMFPASVWEATEFFQQVIDQLVEFAIERHRERAKRDQV
jgi:hypothetical protein